MASQQIEPFACAVEMFVVVLLNAFLHLPWRHTKSPHASVDAAMNRQAALVEESLSTPMSVTQVKCFSSVN